MERLILCGGGHVSLALAQIGALLEFEVAVIDDREEFANAARFPMARRVLAMPFPAALDKLGAQESDFFAVLTRGHSFDEVCVRQILGGRFAYLGMIGSRKKVAVVLEHLRADGFTPDQIAAVHAPIGLNIGGQTPAEIAVSIAAELVQERAKRGPQATLPPAEPGVLVRITRKSGSAPRGVGAWMLVRPDGSTTGTIGGGAVEHQATLDALKFWENGTGTERKSYDLSDTAAQLGMVCGGKIETEFRIQKKEEEKNERDLAF